MHCIYIPWHSPLNFNLRHLQIKRMCKHHVFFSSRNRFTEQKLILQSGMQIINPKSKTAICVAARKKGNIFLLQKFSVVYPAVPLTSLLGLMTTTDFGHSSQTLASKLELMLFRKHDFSFWSRDLMLVPTTQIWYQTFCCCDDMKQTGYTFNKHQKRCLLRNFWGYTLTTVTSSMVFSLQLSRNHLRQILNLKLQWSNYS